MHDWWPEWTNISRRYTSDNVNVTVFEGQRCACCYARRTVSEGEEVEYLGPEDCDE